MANDKTKYLRWSIPDYRKPDRSKTWYILAGIIVLICLFFSFFTFISWRPVFLGLQSNFLFALIIIVAAAITIIFEGRPTMMINVELGSEGLKVGSRTYSYDEVKNFAVLYKPKQSLKNLYLEFNNPLRPRLSLPLRHMDALEVRNFLVRYLEEDLERTEPPVSEQLTKLLKL